VAANATLAIAWVNRVAAKLPDASRVRVLFAAQFVLFERRSLCVAVHFNGVGESSIERGRKRYW
jgi:hypothetical protein